MDPNAGKAVAAVWERVEDVEPWAGNSKIRIINDDDVAECVESFRRFGFGNPMIGWGSRRTIYGGHVRRLATLWLKKHEPSFAFPDAPGPGYVPVRWMEFKSEHEAAAYAVRDNGSLGAWDTAALASWAREMMEAGTSVDGLGIDDSIFASMDANLQGLADAMTGLPDDPGDDGLGGGLDTRGGDLDAEQREQMLPVIRFKQFRVQMSEDEASDLERNMRDYYEAHGTMFGWVREVLG
jgi:hypothetical protein